MQEKNQNKSYSHAFLAMIFLAAILAIVLLTNPHQTMLFVVLFYAALAGFCLNLFMFILEGYVYNPKKASEAAVSPDLHSRIAARQSLLLTLLVVGLMFLSSQQLLYWWLAIIFIFTLIFVEGFFLAN